MGKIYKNGIEYGGGGGDSAGHIILDNDGNAMAEEPNLQFKGLNVTDNSTDEVTEVESVGLNQDSMDDVLNASISGVQVASNGLVYSTEEQVIGKWIDGKPIYQKTITGTATLPAMPSYSSIGTTSELISSDIGDIIDVLITGKGTGAAYQGYQSPASYVAYVNIGGNINVGQGIASGTTEIAYRITVKYTKED